VSKTKNYPELDPEIAAAFDALAPDSHLRGTIGTTAEGIARMRETARLALPSDNELRRGGAVDVEERSIPRQSDPTGLDLLILRPSAGTGPWPCVYFVHGSGMVVGESCRAGMGGAAAWVEEFGTAVVGVDYRVAPEFPHPEPVEDVYTGLRWVSNHATEIDVDPNRIMIVGVSGGGGLAAGTALLCRDRGGPALTHQILVCPMLDDREVTVSSKFEGVIWDRRSNHTGWSALLGESCGGPDVSPYAAPARATNLHGLPPTYLDCGASEVFRDEVMDLGSRLAQAGVPVELHLWSGAMHGSERLAPRAEVSRAAIAARTSYLRRALTRGKNPA